MQCPVDGTTLVMKRPARGEIDYCPQNDRGVWLDRGTGPRNHTNVRIARAAGRHRSLGAARGVNDARS